jgi:hypothetical protein
MAAASREIKMRKSLIGYYPPTTEEFKELWRDGRVVLDANVLLNLYRYSEAARNELLRLLKTLSGQLWIPYQVALEYHRNRIELIRDERKNCDAFLQEFERLVQNLDQTRRHPFVGETLQRKLKNIVQEVRRDITAGAEALDGLKRNDVILDEVTSLYEGRVGRMPDDATTDVWLKDGEERYRRGVPPGFEDRKKISNSKFGDLLLWMELIEFGKSNKVPIIFVTDDAKKDWWREIGGETIGPHPLLVSEMTDATGKPFHMYRPERFIELAGKQLKTPLSAKVVEEVKEAQAADQEAARHSAQSEIQGEKYMRGGRELPWVRRKVDDLRRQQELERLALSHREIAEFMRRERELERLTSPNREIEEIMRREQELERLARPNREIEEIMRREQELERLTRPSREVEEILRREQELKRLTRPRSEDEGVRAPPP